MRQSVPGSNNAMQDVKAAIKAWQQQCTAVGYHCHLVAETIM